MPLAAVAAHLHVRRSAGVRLLDALSQAPGGLHRALATASSTPRRPRSWPVLAVLKSIYTLSNNTYVQRSSRASSASRCTRGSGTGSTRSGWSSRSPSSSLRSLFGSGADSGVMGALLRQVPRLRHPSSLVLLGCSKSEPPKLRSSIRPQNCSPSLYELAFSTL